jgi:hypothetical protein
MDIIARHQYKSTCLVNLFFFLPLFTLTLWLASENIIFTAVYLLTGIIISLAFISILHLAHKYVVAYGIILFFPLWYTFVLGSLLSLVGFSYQAFQGIFSFIFLTVVILFLEVAFISSLLIEYYRYLKDTNSILLKGIDFELGSIDAKKAIIANSDPLIKGIRKSPFWFIAKAVCFVGLPFGGVGLPLIMNHVAPNLLSLVMVLGLYAVMISFSGMLSKWLFILVYILHIQFKHKKAFKFVNVSIENNASH